MRLIPALLLLLLVTSSVLHARVAGTAPEGGRLIDSGRLEYRLQGKPAGYEDFRIEAVGNRLVWSATSVLEIPGRDMQINVTARAVYAAKDDEPISLREYHSTIDAGAATNGMVEIEGEFGGQRNELTVSHVTLSGFSQDAPSAGNPGGKVEAGDARRTGTLRYGILGSEGRPVEGLVALDANGGYSLYSAVALMAAAQRGRAVKRKLLIPSADKENTDGLLIWLTAKQVRSDEDRRVIALDSADAHYEVELSAEGPRLEKIVLKGQGFEAIRVADEPSQQPGKFAELNTGELEIRISGGVLAAMLRRPVETDLATKDGIPAALIVSDAGRRNRDGNIVGRSGGSLSAVLADALAQAGIASLRYDAPGVGGSTGSLREKDLEDLVGDATAALRSLSRASGIDRSRIIMIGHGEGAQLISKLVVERQKEAVSMVWIAPPAASLFDLILERAGYALRREGAPPGEIEGMLRSRRKLLDQMAAARAWEHVLFVDREAESGRLASDFARWKQERPLAYFQQHFMEDPRVLLMGTTVPGLIVSGGKDLEIASSHARSLDETLRRAGVQGHQLMMLPFLDHDLTRTGEVSADRKAVERIVGWVRSTLQ